MTCNGTPGPTSEQVTVTVSSNAETTCVFEDEFTPDGSISLAKITHGGTGTALFLVRPKSTEVPSYAQHVQHATTTTPGVAADAVPNHPVSDNRTDRLALGTYLITEQPPPTTGTWTLTEVQCNGELVPFEQGTV